MQWSFSATDYRFSGAAMAVNVVFKVLEHNAHSSHRTDALPLPVALVMNYPALDFNFTSWMTSDNLRVLRSEESSGNLPGLKELAAHKDHLQNIVSIYLCIQTTQNMQMVFRALSAW